MERIIIENFHKWFNKANLEAIKFMAKLHDKGGCVKAKNISPGDVETYTVAGEWILHPECVDNFRNRVAGEKIILFDLEKNGVIEVDVKKAICYSFRKTIITEIVLGCVVGTDNRVTMELVFDNNDYYPH